VWTVTARRLPGWALLGFDGSAGDEAIILGTCRSRAPPRGTFGVLRATHGSGEDEVAETASDSHGRQIPAAGEDLHHHDEQRTTHSEHERKGLSATPLRCFLSGSSTGRPQRRSHTFQPALRASIMHRIWPCECWATGRWMLGREGGEGISPRQPT
jgi:hypothetical protein